MPMSPVLADPLMSSLLRVISPSALASVGAVCDRGHGFAGHVRDGKMTYFRTSRPKNWYWWLVPYIVNRAGEHILHSL
jgi:hypothetical protein